jgi:hypothetical protein
VRNVINAILEYRDDIKEAHTGIAQQAQEYVHTGLVDDLGQDLS